LSQKNESIACAAETLYKEGKLTVSQIISQLGIARSTFYNYLRHRGVAISSTYTRNK
jgi:AcrR family transcriptional regulator